jgi:S1-C subfamily serine protease
MRSQLLVPLLCAVVGGAVTTATLIAAGVIAPRQDPLLVPAAAPLLASGAMTPGAAAAVYRREAGGVVAVTAHTVPVRATAFDVAAARVDGLTAGSGFVLDDDGRIVTAAHLVRAAGDVEVEIAGTRMAARVLGVDAACDIAVLQVDTGVVDLHPLPLGDSDGVQVGDPALALGSAPGLAPALASGTVAARQDRVTGPGGAIVTGALQTDLRLRELDAGGPLLDAAGRVIGVNTRMALSTDGTPVDVAVPVNAARGVLARLRTSTMKVVGG